MPAPRPTSLLDHVDDADRPIGVVAREDVFRLHAGFRVAHIFVQNRAGELLLQQLGARRERNPLRWGSSVAGYVHTGETYADAAERRLYEELGLRTPLVKLGAIRMSDNGATKFIALFTTSAETAHIREPEHIEAIEFLPVEATERLLASTPRRFTETFLCVFRLFRTITTT